MSMCTGKRFFTNSFCCFLLLIASTAFAQNGYIKGIVEDSSGNPIANANIMLKNTTIGTSTNEFGNYNLKRIKPGAYTIVFSSINFKTKSKTISINSNDTLIEDFIVSTTDAQLADVVVKSIKTISGMGRLDEVHDGIIYSGKKTEVLLLDSLNANTAQNNPRQVLGRVPGAYFSETEGGGFPSNGIAFRGLTPTQSVEIDTRENGYNIAGDIYGYPESYYMPPLQSLDRVEVTRGASSLQFGPQFGGVVNYIVKNGPADKPFEYTSEQTAGSFGLFSSFNSIGGTYKKWSYYSFVQYEGIQGWRPNSDVQQALGFAKVAYQANSKLKIGLEYSLLRNYIHMPGGLDDSEYNVSAKQSFRSRNWLKTPWNIIALTAEYKLSDQSLLTLKSALNLSARDIVWRSEDGGAGAIDSVVNNSYKAREVEHEGFKSSTTELRLLTNYTIGSTNEVLAAGVRIFSGDMNREEGGTGSTGTDFDFNLYGGGYENSLRFTTFNIAPFFENTFHIGSHLSITPGFRYEYIMSAATGYVTDHNDSTGNDSIINVNETKPRSIALAGIGVQYKITTTTNIYANISQAYRPIEYSFQYPFGFDVNAKIDPNLKDISGFNADMGWRGSVKKYLNFDVGAFYLLKKNEIAIETLLDPSNNPYLYETNVADAVHKGIETYVELDVTKLFKKKPKWGAISFFNSFAYDDAKYINGLYKGNLSAYAPSTIERFGITYSIKGFSTTFSGSSISQSYSDANNTVYSPDAEVGIIPSYQVFDWSATLKIKNYKIKCGVNNLADKKYFTLRTPEYPGPGIIPSIGRSIYLGFGATF
jgi:Fe(3+) dicitrate transport protein